jgi:hemoglobin
MRKLTYIAVLALAGASMFVSCKKEEDTTPTPTKSSLYTRLGGINAIAAVTDTFLVKAATDSRIASFFAPTVDPSGPKDADGNLIRFRNLRTQLIDQICATAGGPCTYNGLTMEKAHKGMNITDADFNALVEDLVYALDKFSVPEAEKTELLTALAGLKSSIVGK